MRYLTSAKLSEHISKTPEGYLLCLAVPIARTGDLEYGADEVPVEPSADGRVRVTRLPDDVFEIEAIASFEGKPITTDHPDDDVTPATWKELAVGHAQNVRRGEGAESDLLIADLLITDQDAIDLVRGGLRELSCGYDADYEQEAPGRGWQRNIRGNHIALVRRGRCGPRCKINDKHEETMNPTKTKQSYTDRLMAMLKSPKARRALDEAMDEGPEAKPKEGDNPTPATDEGEDRLAALEAKVEELSILVRQVAEAKAEDEETEAVTGDEGEPEKTGDEDEPESGTKTGDSAKSRTRDARTVDADTKARAAILSPGLRVCDTDKRCAVQRAALRMTSKDKAVDAVVKATLRGGTLDSCDCVTLDAAFVAASEVAKVGNNRRTADGLAKASTQDFGKTTTPADINKANADFYGKRS
jgi:hypothetical protein